MWLLRLLLERFWGAWSAFRTTVAAAAVTLWLLSGATDALSPLLLGHCFADARDHPQQRAPERCLTRHQQELRFHIFDWVALC